MEGEHNPGSRMGTEAVEVSTTLRRAQDRLAQLLGASAAERSNVVAKKLERSAHESTAYWLQLTVSVGIATLGLVVGSTAVIIGAMLVAPLMGPIVSLALGLATGSPFLVLRSASRVVMSVAVAIGGAAIITALVPFHEVNAEIAARTSPTVLDLLTAAFCAVAGVYAFLRPGSDTAATAAGTSIGISLVPPLCTSGFGLGTELWRVAGGAALLFLTNLVAIIFIGTLCFVASGFNRVDVVTLERAELAKNQQGKVTAIVARRLAGLFESKWGPALRFLMPLLLFGAVYMPLRRALDEVAWEVKARAAVQAALRREPDNVVQSQVHVEPERIELRVVVVGSADAADAARARLGAAIQSATRVAPHIEVLAVPDATSLSGLESELRTKFTPAAAPERPAPSSSERLATASANVREILARVWPTEALGAPLAIDVGAEERSARSPLRIRVVHLGVPMGRDAAEGVARSVSSMLATEVKLVDDAIPAATLSRADGDAKLVSAVTAGVRASAQIASIHVCVTEPPKGRRARGDTRGRDMDEALREVLLQHPRATFTEGDDWTVRFALGSCDPATTTRDAGASDSG